MRALRARREPHELRRLVDAAAGLPWQWGERADGTRVRVLTTSLRNVQTDEEGEYYEIGARELEAIEAAALERPMREGPSRLSARERADLGNRVAVELEAVRDEEDPNEVARVLENVERLRGTARELEGAEPTGGRRS